MTDYKEYINALRKCAKEHEKDQTYTGHIIVSDLCRDTANLLEMSDWIPCTEKVPDDCRQVLVTLKHSDDDYEVTIGEYWDTDDPKEHGWGSYGPGEVIAWTEMPKPYKEEEK